MRDTPQTELYRVDALMDKDLAKVKLEKKHWEKDLSNNQIIKALFCVDC